jgi:glycine oxidase
MGSRTDCLIVGGGVIGLALAWQLAERGRKVRLIDRQELGREASWAGAGILPPANRLALAHPLDQLRGLSFELHRDWAQVLKGRTVIDTGYRQCGGVYLARATGEAAALSAWAATLGDEGVKVESLQIADCRLQIEEERGRKGAKEITCSSPPRKSLFDLEPGLAQNAAAPLRAAWYLPDECQLRNPRYLQALTRMCELSRVEMTPNCEVLDWGVSNGRVDSVLTSQSTIQADQVCVTSGAWSGGLLQKLGINLGVMPVRGQMVLFRTERPIARAVINEGPRYLVPRDDGRLLAGSTEEEVGFDKRTTEEGIAELMEFATSLLPGLKSAEVERTWAGLRPASFDGFPYLGPVPGFSNAFVAAGQYRSG